MVVEVRWGAKSGWDVYKEMGVPLLWDSDSYADDLPYWVDVPSEKNEEKPQGMLMIPYSYGQSTP